MTVTLKSSVDYNVVRLKTLQDANGIDEISSTNPFSEKEYIGGKDDGDIRAGKIFENVKQDSCDTFFKTIKSCFMDENGNFSLAKTCITTLLAATCFLFPPVGVPLCAVGIGACAVQMGKEVYDVAHATNKNDAG